MQSMDSKVEVTAGEIILGVLLDESKLCIIASICYSLGRSNMFEYWMEHIMVNFIDVTLHYVFVWRCIEKH